MRKAIKIALAVLLAGAFGAASALVVTAGLGGKDARWATASATRSRGGSAPPSARGSSGSLPAFPLFGAGEFETGGYGTATRFTGPIVDRGSIEQVRAAFAARSRGIADRLAELQAIPEGVPDPSFRRLPAQASLVFLMMYEGKFAEAAEWTERALAGQPGGPARPAGQPRGAAGRDPPAARRDGELPGLPRPVELHLADRGRGGASAAVGLRAAIGHFTSYLRQRPEDLGVRWLLNVAYMTLGEYPEKVPPEWRIPLEPFRSRLDIGRFDNVAAQAGLNARGPNMAGGSLFDDFTGDGLPDVFTTSFDTDLGASLFVNRGDGTFEDRSGSAGLEGQVLAVNVAQADFDNDGRLDVIMVRGGWENAARLTLLRNAGNGRFTDVTIAAGLGEPIASHSAAWGDFDNDGRVDLYVCGEYAASSSAGLFAGDNSLIHADPREHGRLYRNTGDGTFTDVAEKAGVRNDRYAKGAAWGDFDNDGHLDLYVSNFGEENRLYRNNGDGTFTDVAHELGVTEPAVSFTCGFFDFDNDGRLDLFVSDYGAMLEQWVAGMIGHGDAGAVHPRLFHNEGPHGLPRRGADGRDGPPRAGDGDGRRRRRQRRVPRHLPWDWPSRLLGLDAERPVQERRGPAFRGHHRLVGDRTPPEGAWGLVRRLRRRRGPRPLRRGRRRRAGRPGEQPPVPQPGTRPALAERQANRQADEPGGDRRADQGGFHHAVRQGTLGLPARRRRPRATAAARWWNTSASAMPRSWTRSRSPGRRAARRSSSDGPPRTARSRSPRATRAIAWSDA